MINLYRLLMLLVLATTATVLYLLVWENSPESDKSSAPEFVTLLTYLNEEVLNPSGTYAKFDRSLCEYPQPEKKYYVGIKPCPKHVVTVEQAGRLCNQIWEYLAVWAAAKRTGYEPYVPTCLYNTVNAMYDSLTVGRLEEIAHCPLNESSFVYLKFESWDGTSNLIFPKYIIEAKLVLDYRIDFPKEFVLRKHLAMESQRQLQLLRLPKNTVYVGVHIRKTDYAAYLKRKFGRKPADAAYYEEAMTVFEGKYEQVAFVMVSDDSNWCYKYFGKRKNVYVIGYGKKNSAEIDLAILSSCNHTIFDYGTYGTWGAIMAGGETIYYNLTEHLTSRIGKILNWETL